MFFATMPSPLMFQYIPHYQATKVKTVDELLNILSLRPEYFGEEGEAGPFVYNNGEYIGTLKAKA